MRDIRSDPQEIQEKDSVNILKFTELYSLTGWILWHVNYMSIKLLLKKKTTGRRP